MRVHVEHTPVFADLVDERDVPVDVVDRRARPDRTRLDLHRIKIGQRVLVHVGPNTIGRRRHRITDRIDDVAPVRGAADAAATRNPITFRGKADVAAAARIDAADIRERQPVLPRVIRPQHVDEIGAVGVEVDTPSVGAEIRIGLRVDAVVGRLAAAFADALDERRITAFVLFAPRGLRDAPRRIRPRRGGGRKQHQPNEQT